MKRKITQHLGKNASVRNVLLASFLSNGSSGKERRDYAGHQRGSSCSRYDTRRHDNDQWGPLKSHFFTCLLPLQTQPTEITMLIPHLTNTTIPVQTTSIHWPEVFRPLDPCWKHLSFQIIQAECWVLAHITVGQTHTVGVISSFEFTVHDGQNPSHSLLSWSRISAVKCVISILL